MRRRLNMWALGRYLLLVAKYQDRGIRWLEATDCAARRMGWGGHERELRMIMSTRATELTKRVWL